MLVLKLDKGARTICNETDEKVCKGILTNGYTVKLAYLKLMYEFLTRFDKIILVDYPVFVGSSTKIVSIACKSYIELLHELLPYMDEYVILSDINFSAVRDYSFCVNLYYVEHSNFRDVILPYIRKRTIDEILEDIC